MDHSEGGSSVCRHPLAVLMVRKFDQKLHCVRRKASKRIVVTLCNYCHLFASGLKLLNKTGPVAHRPEIGRASCGDRVWQSVRMSLVAVALKKKKLNNNTT